MKVTIDSRAKAIYVKLRDGKPARTKEFSPTIFADIDSTGKLLGVEMLRPGSLTIREIARKYNRPILNRIAPDLERIYEKLSGSR